MQQTVKDYVVQIELKNLSGVPRGDSAAPKDIIFHILEDNSQSVDVLDIGFGVGNLGRLIKGRKETSHWSVDGIDGWQANCVNKELIEKNIYRNIWNGLAQELPYDAISKYKIICLLDVIEHLDIESAKWLFRTLLTSMGEKSFLFISTPLWFYPNGHLQDGDLEEHLIGVPVSAMMAVIPKMYSIKNPLVGGFVYTKYSLNFVDFFQPTSNKEFSYEMGMEIINSINLPHQSGVLYKVKN